METTIVDSGVRISFDGGQTWWGWETPVTRIDNWVETPVGRVNYGHVRMGIPRMVPATPTKDNPNGK